MLPHTPTPPPLAVASYDCAQITVPSDYDHSLAYPLLMTHHGWSGNENSMKARNTHSTPSAHTASPTLLAQKTTYPWPECRTHHVLL